MQEVQQSKAELSSMLSLANRMARRYGRIGTNEPEDIAQNAMLKLLRRTSEQPATSGWLYKTVRSAAFDAGRAHAREQQYLAHCHSYVRQSDEAEKFTSVCERADEAGYVHTRGTYVPARDEQHDPNLVLRLKAVLQQLGQPMREVLVLYAEGMSYEQIAAMTSSKIGTVRSRLHYARKQTRALLGDLA